MFTQPCRRRAARDALLEHGDHASMNSAGEASRPICPATP
jgi:hypothetical protein